MTRGDALFSTPLLTFMVPDADELNARLLAEIAVIRTAGGGLKRSNYGGWHSNDDLFMRIEPALVALRDEIVEAIGLATSAIAPEEDLGTIAVQAEGWINVNGTDAFNTPHDHPNWTWSGSYYVSVPEPDGRSGAIEFFDPRANVRAFGVEGAACLAPTVTVAPTNGMMLLFPAWLKHWVYPNGDDAERVSIAFNARLARAPTE
jgi:uncharacterized protein (TIGR02466 family)